MSAVFLVEHELPTLGVVKLVILGPILDLYVLSGGHGSLLANPNPEIILLVVHLNIRMVPSAAPADIGMVQDLVFHV